MNDSATRDEGSSGDQSKSLGNPIVPPEAPDEMREISKGNSSNKILPYLDKERFPHKVKPKSKGLPISKIDARIQSGADDDQFLLLVDSRFRERERPSVEEVIQRGIIFGMCRVLMERHFVPTSKADAEDG